MTLPTLPEDIVLQVLQYLEAHDLLRLQLASRTCRIAFSDPSYLRTILKCHNLAREVRALPRALLTTSDITLPDQWLLQSTFYIVATRYYHLTQGRARTIQHLNLRALDQSGHWFPTPQWDYHESQPGGRLYHESAAAHLRGMGWKPYLFRQTLWDYDDGVVVCAPAKAQDRVPAKQAERSSEDTCLRAMGLETGAEAEVPFDVTGKIIRNLRLKERVLIVEWAEKEAFHELNMVDKVHRHFATCYDVTITNTDKNNPSLNVKYRSEWRIHFLGLPLSTRDYFFSTHTATHYALYYWQPNRSLWTGDEDQPIEALFIWDITSPSSYRPSLDPSQVRARHGEGFGTLGEGPRRVARYGMHELEWLGIRQHASISLIKIELDSENKVLIWRENRFVSGQGYFDPAERCWESRNVSFPFVGDGCVQERMGDVETVSYRGHCSMDSQEVEGEVEGWFLPVSEVGDGNDGVRYGLIETCFTGLVVENRILVRVRLGRDGEWRNLQDELVKQLGAMGRICGDERWVIGQNEKLQIVIARFQ